MDLSGANLLLPLDPSRVSKVIGVAGNFPPPGDRTDAPHPRWFAKLPTSLNPHDATVDLPPFAENFNFEGELVIVIGKAGRHISIEDAPGYVFGVTIGNDWSENTWYYEQAGVEEPSRQIAKSLDTWACLYTTIVSDLDYSDLPIKIRVNGVPTSEGRTSEMINRPDWLIAYFSQFVTLLPGDVIYTGTPVLLPDTSRVMKDGDEVEVEIPPIGVLRNRVVAMDAGLFPDGSSMKIRSAR